MRRSLWCWGVGILLLGVLFTPTENGRWQCGLCGRHERRFLALSLPVWRRTLSTSYHDWFDDSVRRPHDHDWVYVGCHYRGNMIWGILACTMTRMTLQDEIPLLPRDDLSRKAVDKLFSLSGEARRQEFRDFDGIDPDRNSPSYADWWSHHSLWQDVFPPPANQKTPHE